MILGAMEDEVQITRAAGCSWTFIVVYATPSCVSSRALWENLSWLALSILGAWLIGSDFNGTLLLCEKRSSATFWCFVNRDFLKWVDMHEIRDVGFARPEFTWK
ncbi:hypothetical protein K1719_003446 [Acacia pycnantha]|nr:hypothetical protein K1719_003446 [Acacia pycnantha]